MRYIAVKSKSVSYLISRCAFAVALVAAPVFAPLPAAAQDLDLDEVFRCTSPEDGGQEACLAARETLLNNCTTCHTFVPIVMQQFEPGGWESLIHRHVAAGRVKQLSEEKVAELQAYLTDNFNPDHPQPDLPPSLLATWTSY